MTEPPVKRRKVDGHRQAPNDLSFEDFAPSGDVVFVVKGKTRVRVRSAVMMGASSVFNAMLGPNFVEGRALAEARAVEIALPEDGPEAFRWICRALHCQASTKLWKPETTQICEIWRLIDKYDMKDGMQLSLGFWISEQINRENATINLWYLARLSLLIQDADSFAVVTRKLILHTAVSFVSLATFSESYKLIIPGRLLYKLAATLQEARDSSMAKLAKLLYIDLPEELQACNYATARYFQALKRAFKGLSVTLGFPDTTVSLETVFSVIPSIISHAKWEICCGEEGCQGNFEQLLKKASNLKLGTFPADELCLYCFDGPECCPDHKK